MQFDLATPMVVTGEMTLKMDASLEAMGQSADMRADVRMTFKPKDGLKSTHTAEPAGDDAGGGDAVAPGGGEVEAPGGVVGGEAPSDEVPAKAPAEDVPTEEPTVTP